MNKFLIAFLILIIIALMLVLFVATALNLILFPFIGIFGFFILELVIFTGVIILGVKAIESGYPESNQIK